MNNNRGCLGFIASLFGIKTSPTPLPYSHRFNFLSAAELSFYKVLSTTLDKNNYVILCKVNLGDIFFTKSMRHWNMISRKHMDFLLCNPHTMKPILGIELDDVSHKRQDRQDRDLLVNSVFKVAKLLLLRIKAQREYNTQQLLQAINQQL